MEMARKHFGLSYLEELSIVKKRENLCKKSRQEFLKFKQETANVQTNLNKPVFEDAQPDQSHQLEPYSWERRWGPPLPLENTNLPVERDSFKSLETVTLFPDVTVMEHQTQHLKSEQKKLHKEDPKLDSHLDEDKTRPVAIASLVGTTKQVSMLKKPERLPKPKYRKFVCAKPMSEKPFSLQHKVYDTEKPEQKIYSQHKIMENVKTGSVILETNYSITVDSSSSTKSPRIPKTISKPSTQFSVVELERTISKKISKIPSTKSFSRFSHEYRGPRKSKIYDKFIPQNKIQIQDSDEKFPPGVVPRSIDEIIASLQSTAPTLSDLRIKELLESVLGHDYNIKIEPQVIERERKPSLMEMPFEEATTVQMEQLEVESWIEDRSSPAEQATPADSEQTQLDTPQHLRLSSISPATEKGYIKVEKDTPKARAQETSSVLLPQMIPSFQESEEGMLSSEGIQLYESASLVPEVLEKVKSEEQEEFLFDSISSCTLEIRGKTFPQTKPVEIQESLEEIPQQQPLSLLSTWTTKIKDVDHPLIHHLCTASLRCALPTDMQLVSRVSHTSDKIGHDASLPAINPGYYESEDIFPTITCLEKQREINRILNEGVPVSEAYQCSQKEKNTVLPLHSPETMTEWQKKAEYCIEKPQLKLLGEQVKLHPGTLKMFWTPAPIKFSTPLSVMKQTLFSKYESNLINGVIYEDFSCDLHEEEEVESEDDFDYLLSTISIDRRRYSCPEFPVSTTFELCLSRRSASEPKLLLDRDKSAFKIAADFKATMQELMSAKQEASSTTAKITSSPAIQFSKDTPDVYSASKIGQTENIPPKQEVNKAILAEESRKAGMKYIVFPKRKGTKKSGKHLSPVLLQSVYVELQNAPRILKRSTSLGKLYTHNKYTIKVPQSVKCYRHPSLPHLLDFHTFAENRGGISEYRSDYAWVKEIWNKWFDEVYPSSSEHAEVKAQLVKKTAKAKPKEKEKELTDSAPIAEDVTSQLDGFQSEVDRLTHQIEEGCALAFNYCRRGAVYRKTGKLKAAMDDLEKAISLEPMLLNAYWHRHLLFLYQNKTRQAMEDLNFIIKCNKSHADAYLSRAEIFKKQGDNSLAIINYTLAMRCRPTDDEIYFKRAVLHEEEGDLLLAIEDYSKCINYNPRRTDALMKHGVYCFQKSNWLVAINDFTDVIEIDPNNADARTYRGRAYLKYEEFKKAAADFSAAIHLNPRNWLAFYYRGCILRKVDPKQALQDFSVSVLLNHDYENLSSFIHRGILYSEMKQWALAVCDFENAVALDRSLTLPYINIGLIMLLHLDHYLEAIELFTRAIRVNPLDTRPYLCRAQAYQKMQQLKDSLKDITRAIHLQPDSPHFCLIRGKYLLEMGNYKLASFCIHQVAEMEKGSVEYSLVQEALVQSFCQNHSKAIECAQIATKRQPEPSTFVLLGKIQMKAKKHKDAVASFKQALKLLMGTGKAVPCTFEAAEMYYFIGQCYMEQVSLIEACDAFSAAVRMYPRYTDAFYERGLCRMQLQQDKCLRDFNKVLAISPKHFQAYLSRAAFYGSKGRYSKAIMNCTEAINIHPNSVRAYLYRGALKIYNKTFKNAIEDLTKTIQLDNMCFLAYYNRGIGYHQIKDYKNALKDYSIVLLLEPNKDIVLKVLINRALIYVDLDQYAYSLEDFIEASLSKPKDTKLFQALAICYHRLQQYEKAVKTFSTVLKLDPFSLDGYIGRGNSYMEYGHDAGSKQAQKDFLKAIHLNPLCIKAKLCLGYNLQSLGKFQKAWHQFSAVIHIDPECHTAYDGRAIVCLQMGDTFAAFQDINVALKITTTAELLTNRGVINQFMGYLSCAMKDYQQAISVDPNYALAYFNAANMYFLNRQFSQANNYYSKSLTLDAKNESAFLNRAITNTLLKNFEEAKADFEKAINLSPFSAAIYYNKANLYNTLQQYEQAEEDISKALSIQPYDPLMYKLRADIRGKLGFIKEAIADYKKAIDIQELIFKG